MSEFVPLKRVALVRYGLGQPPPESDEGVPILRATNIYRGAIRPEGLIRARLEDLPLDRAPLLCEGEVLVVRSGAYTGDSALVPEKWAGSAPGYDLRVTPTGGLDAQFLAYSLLGRHALDQMRLASSRAAQPHLNAEELGEVEICRMPLPDQRAIVGYLEAETARIDSLVAKKRKLVSLLRDRVFSVAGMHLRSDQSIPLRRLADLLPGYTFPSEWFSPASAGPRLLRGVNVGVGSIRWHDCVYLDRAREGLGRYRLREGDLVLGMDRPFVSGGTRVADVTAGSAGSLLVQRVCRIRAISADVAVVVRHTLSSSLFAAHVEPDLTGVSVPHLSESQIGSFPVPAPRGSDFAAAAEALSIAGRQSAVLMEAVRQQIDLLLEHRQALITAAVTGELDIPGVAA